MERILTNPDDIRLVRDWTAEARMRSLRNVLFGAAALVAAAGIGIAAIVWANNQGLDPEVLQAALAKMPALKVEKVQLDPASTVSLRDGAQVELKNGGVVGLDPKASVSIEDGGKVGVDGTVGIEPGSTVLVEGELKAQPMPTLPDVQSQPKPAEAIARRVTVFTEIPWRGGKIVTGWEFGTGASKRPSTQYCYFSVTTGTTGASERVVHLTKNGNNYSVKPSELANADIARTKCVWFRGAV